jgi:hypothetical protein
MRTTDGGGVPPTPLLPQEQTRGVPRRRGGPWGGTLGTLSQTHAGAQQEGRAVEARTCGTRPDRRAGARKAAKLNSGPRTWLQIRRA